MKLLTEEQLKEIEQREDQKRIQQELEEQRLREVEMKRREDERKAREDYLKQLRVKHEPLISMIEKLDDTNYLVIQYQNVNGRVATYKFKSKDETHLNEFWIDYDSEFNIYISNGYDKRSIIFNNILGAEIFEEIIADVVIIERLS